MLCCQGSQQTIRKGGNPGVQLPWGGGLPQLSQVEKTRKFLLSTQALMRVCQGELKHGWVVTFAPLSWGNGAVGWRPSQALVVTSSRGHMHCFALRCSRLLLERNSKSPFKSKGPKAFTDDWRRPPFACSSSTCNMRSLRLANNCFCKLQNGQKVPRNLVCDLIFIDITAIYLHLVLVE